MIRLFKWTLIFWTLFIITNTIGDATRFYSGFTFFGDMRLWHLLKFFWIAWLWTTGAFSILLLERIYFIVKYKLKMIGVIIFFIAWFFLFRWITHEAFMSIWRQ